MDSRRQVKYPQSHNIIYVSILIFIYVHRLYQGLFWHQVWSQQNQSWPLMHPMNTAVQWVPALQDDLFEPPTYIHCRYITSSWNRMAKVLAHWVVECVLSHSICSLKCSIKYKHIYYRLHSQDWKHLTLWNSFFRFFFVLSQDVLDKLHMLWSIQHILSIVTLTSTECEIWDLLSCTYKSLSGKYKMHFNLGCFLQALHTSSFLSVHYAYQSQKSHVSVIGSCCWLTDSLMNALKYRTLTTTTGYNVHVHFC